VRCSDARFLDSPSTPVGGRYPGKQPGFVHLAHAAGRAGRPDEEHGREGAPTRAVSAGSPHDGNWKESCGPPYLFGPGRRNAPIRVE
jgi:hypothetical protein